MVEAVEHKVLMEVYFEKLRNEPRDPDGVEHPTRSLIRELGLERLDNELVKRTKKISKKRLNTIN